MSEKDDSMETVYLGDSSAYRKRVYHTETGCTRLNDWIEWERSQVPEDYTECEWCSGEVELGAPEGPRLAHQLQERGRCD